MRDPGIVVVPEMVSSVIRRYNVASLLSEGHPYQTLLPFCSCYGMEGIGDIGRGLVDALQDDVCGVEEIILNRYSITVQINVAFGWDSVDPGILAAIESLVGPICTYEPVDEEDLYTSLPSRTGFDDDNLCLREMDDLS